VANGHSFCGCDDIADFKENMPYGTCKQGSKLTAVGHPSTKPTQLELELAVFAVTIVLLLSTS
ncbi:unnamed protein product, partial [Brassica rapa subsp. trilocularis]